ncbi:MAG: sugar transferase [Acidobacteriota bacterium]
MVEPDDASPSAQRSGFQQRGSQQTGFQQTGHQQAGLRRVAKKLVDYVAAGFLMALASPLLIAVATLVKLTSPGPVLFRQERLGKHQRPFVMLKFRSMHHGVSEEPHRAYITKLMDTEAQFEGGTDQQKGLYKLADDARLTPVGDFLRRTSLDELPQLFNVLRGEMSLVGPRPVLAYEVELYEPEMLERFEAEPGITGLWQVQGRSSLSYRNMVELDVEYVRRWSFLLDLKILVGTVGAVLWHQERAR